LLPSAFFAFSGESLFFEWPKKSNQKKSTPTKLACGFPALLGAERACGTRFAQTVLGLIAQPLRYSAAWKGGELQRIGVAFSCGCLVKVWTPKSVIARPTSPHLSGRVAQGCREKDARGV